MARVTISYPSHLLNESIPLILQSTGYIVYNDKIVGIFTNYVDSLFPKVNIPCLQEHSICASSYWCTSLYSCYFVDIKPTPYILQTMCVLIKITPSLVHIPPNQFQVTPAWFKLCRVGPWKHTVPGRHGRNFCSNN